MFKNITLIETDSTIYFWSFCELVRLIHKNKKNAKKNNWFTNRWSITAAGKTVLHKFWKNKQKKNWQIYIYYRTFNGFSRMLETHNI